MTPRVNLDMHFAAGVLLTTTYFGRAVGRNDARLFEYEPPSEQPVVIRAGQAGAL